MKLRDERSMYYLKHQANRGAMEKQDGTETSPSDPSTAWLIASLAILTTIIVAIMVNLPITEVEGGNSGLNASTGQVTSSPSATRSSSDSAATPASYTSIELQPFTAASLDSADTQAFHALGFEAPIASELRETLPAICSDVADGLSGLLEFGDINDVDASSLLNLQYLYQAVAIKYTCPAQKAEMQPLARAMLPGLGVSAEVPLDLQPMIDALESNAPSDRAPADSTVTCADGWISHSKGKQGACSHHGGIG